MKIQKLSERPPYKLLLVLFLSSLTYRYVVHTYDSETEDTMVELVTLVETLTLL